MSHTPYAGGDYLDFDAVLAECRALADWLPDWVAHSTIGETARGRPIPLLTLGRQDGRTEDRPGFWLDAGTHAAEWTGVMAALYAAGRWCTDLAANDAAALDWFAQHTVYVVPCISPDGFEAMLDGAPFLRSTLRPPPVDAPHSGLVPRDMDGDGAVRWMRWRHPAGPYVADPDVPLFMRPRRLEDDPREAWFVAEEGELVDWDGHRWTPAPREHGLDLNRNFPSHWAPFEMFGMDSGLYALDAPESRAIVDTFAARPRIAAAVSNHT